MTIHGIMQLRHGGVSRGPRLGYFGGRRQYQSGLAALKSRIAVLKSAAICSSRETAAL